MHLAPHSTNPTLPAPHLTFLLQLEADLATASREISWSQACNPLARSGTPGVVDLESDTSQVHPLAYMAASLSITSVRWSVPDDLQSLLKYTTSDSLVLAATLIANSLSPCVLDGTFPSSTQRVGNE